MFCQLFGNMWTFCHRIFPTHLQCSAGFSAKCRCFVAWFLDICDVLPPAQQNVDGLSQDFFNTFAMSSPLFSKMWTFCHMIFWHLWCPAACSAKCGRFVATFLPTFVMSKGLLKEMWTLSEEKNSKKSHETVPLNNMWTTPCLGRAVLFSLSSYTAL